MKYIGPSRMKLLNNSGITSIKQLDETPLEKLARIESIGVGYAKLIKEAVAEYYGEKPEELDLLSKSGNKKKLIDISLDLSKRVQTLNKRLKQTRENLKPLGKKKYLKPYINLKKSSNTLKSLLNDLGQIEEGLPRKIKKKIIQNIDALNLTLKKAGEKPKKKFIKN